MPFQSHEVNRRLLSSPNITKFSRQKLCGEGEVPYETDVTGVIGHAHYIWRSNISKIGTKSNVNLFIFAFHILFDPTTIAAQQFCPLNILKSTKILNIKYYFIIYKNLLISLHFSPQCLPTNKGSPFARKLVLSLVSHWQFVKLNKVTK